jgi:hypothetical protein
VNDSTIGKLPTYKSIADCEICARIPQKVAEDIQLEKPRIIPPQVDQLLTVIELDDESTHRYCTSTTRLLKCSLCGTYYYYNHYDDDGEFFMDPASDTITVRRYDPVTAIDFMERIVAAGENALPKTLGQMTKAFAEGTIPPATRIAGESLDAKTGTVQIELDQLKDRYGELMRELGQLIQQRELDWHIKAYAVESLCYHFVSQGDWASLSAVLLRHPDPVVRLLTAKMVIGIGTDDAPAIDLVHVARALREALKAEMARKARMNEVAGVLLEIALADYGVTLVYDHGYGASSYKERHTRYVALYGLVVAAGHKADLGHAIPALCALLSDDKYLNYHVGWVLRTLAEKKKKDAHAIRDELVKLDRPGKRKVWKDPNVQQVVEACEKRLKTKKQPK